MGRHVGDFTLDVLKEYKPELTGKPKDFEAFWTNEKHVIKNTPIKVDVNWLNYSLPMVDLADLTFHSWDETPIKGYFMRPNHAKVGPVMIMYHGYTGNRGFPNEYLKFVLQGISIISFDVRGQGDSPDFARYENGSRIQGWMTSGILDKQNYYYTNVYRDILAILNWLKTCAPIKPTSIGVYGGSQGGGLSLVTAGLDEGINYVVADYPFMTHFERALEIALRGPYMEIINYFKLHDPEYQNREKILQTLSYVDALHFCDRIDVPVLMGTGLEDPTTPPSTVFAAFNHIKSDNKKLEVYHHYIHEGNQFHDEKKIGFIYEQVFGK